MKKITTFFFAITTILVNAQTNPATPNAGFESWTQHSGYSDPVGWNDLNSSTGIFGFYTCIQDSTPADVHSGKYSVRLVTQSEVGQLIPGTITTGTINTGKQTISGGLPYTLRPDSIIGWYKYTSASGDNADIEFYLFDASSDTVGEAFFKTPTSSVNNYTRMSYVITYRSANAVATALWIVTSSINQTNGHTGSQLYVDDLGLKFDTATGVKSVISPGEMIVGPTPAKNFVTLTNAPATSPVFTLYDITGRKMEENKLIAGTNIIPIDNLPAGLYFYSITGTDNSVMKCGKVIVQK